MSLLIGCATGNLVIGDFDSSRSGRRARTWRRRRDDHTQEIRVVLHNTAWLVVQQSKLDDQRTRATFFHKHTTTSSNACTPIILRGKRVWSIGTSSGYRGHSVR